MVREGAWVLGEFEWGVDNVRDYAERIFRTMLSASPQFVDRDFRRVR